MFCSPEMRRPKAETRKQKSEGRAGGGTFSVFGLRISFGFRISVLGFGMARTDFRAALESWCLVAPVTDTRGAAWGHAAYRGVVGRVPPRGALANSPSCRRAKT